MSTRIIGSMMSSYNCYTITMRQHTTMYNNNGKERNRYNFPCYVKEKFANTGRRFMQQIRDNLEDNGLCYKTKDQ